MYKHLEYLSEKKTQILIFLTICISHLLFIFNSQHISSFPTEAIDLSAASYFGGRDWSSIIELSDYYGTGFYILFTPLFWIFNRFINIRFTILIILCIICAIQGVITYKIQRTFLLTNNTKAFFISVLLSFMSIVHTDVAINEPPLEFCMWIILLLTLSNIKNYDTIYTYSNSIIIAFFLTWTRTIHERALTFLIAYCITILYLYVFFKKKCVKITVFLPSLIAGYFLSNKYIHWIKNLLWGTVSISRNTVDAEFNKAFDSITKLLFSKAGLTSFFDIIISQFFTAEVYSCGIFLIALLYLSKFLFSSFWVKEKTHTTDLCHIAKIFIILCYGMCAIVTVVFMAISCLQGVMIAKSSGTGSRVYTHLRYFYIYLPPLYMILFNEFEKIKSKFFLFTSIIYFFVLKTATYILYSPLVKKIGNRLDVSHYFSPFSLRKPYENMEMTFFLRASFIILVIHLLFYFVSKKGYKKSLLVIIAVTTLYSYIYTDFSFISFQSSRYYKYINAYCDKIYNGFDGEINCIYITSNKYSAYIATLEMSDNQIKYEKNMEDIVLSTNDIIISNTLPEQPPTKYSIKLDQDEYILFSNEHLYMYTQTLQ